MNQICFECIIIDSYEHITVWWCKDCQAKKD